MEQTKETLDAKQSAAIIAYDFLYSKEQKAISGPHGDEVEDAIQAVCCKALKGKLESTDKLYLYKVFQHALLDRQRYQRRRGVESVIDQKELDEAEGGDGCPMIDDINRETADAIQLAFASGQEQYQFYGSIKQPRKEFFADFQGQDIQSLIRREMEYEKRSDGSATEKVVQQRIYRENYELKKWYKNRIEKIL